MRYRPQGMTKALCPYYVTDSRYSISCEAYGGGNRHRLEFDEAAKKTVFLKGNCFLRKNFDCPYRKMCDDHFK